MSAAIQVELKGLAKPKWWEYVLRFVFGGVVTVATGAVAKAYGSSIGGLFLAFPAIVPASLTLLMKHDGRRACVEESRGSICGAVGMVVFAAVVAAASEHWPAAVVLSLATICWAATSTLLWLLSRPLLAR